MLDFIDFNALDSYSFGLGYIFCMISDVVLAFATFLLEKSFEMRGRRRKSPILDNGDITPS